MLTRPTTLFLSDADIAAAVRVDEALDLLAKGFRMDGTDRTPPRARTDHGRPADAAGPSPGRLPGVPAYATREVWASPTPRRVVCLRDLDTAAPLAALDAAAVTAWRDGLVAALATHTLAAPRATTVGFVGVGPHARAAVAGLRHLRRWERIVAVEADPTRVAALPATPLRDPAAVLAASDAVVLEPAAPHPPLRPVDVRAGQHLTVLGPPRPGRRALTRALVTGCRLIVDDVDAAMHRGVLGGAGLNAAHCDGTLGQALRGEVSGPAPADRPSVYAATGLPWQDLVVSWVAYRHAVTTGTGGSLDPVA